MVVIAAEVELLSAQRGGKTLNSQPFGTFKSQPGM